MPEIVRCKKGTDHLGPCYPPGGVHGDSHAKTGGQKIMNKHTHANNDCIPTHTPTPLESLIGTSSNGIVTMAGIENYLHSPYVDKQFKYDLAAFIVRACSNYEGMIELFREIYSENGGTNGKLKGKIEEVFKQAGEVL